MAVKPRTWRMPHTYFKLLKRFPLIHIRDELHLYEALEPLTNCCDRSGTRGPRSTWTS